MTIPAPRANTPEKKPASAGAIISKLRERLRQLEVRFLMWAMFRDARHEILTISQVTAERMSQGMAVKLAQNLLAKEGIATCFACLTRFGLRKLKNGQRACERHTEAQEPMKAAG